MSNVLQRVDVIRKQANNALNPKTRSKLGQFFTGASVSLFMASLFDNIDGDIRLLDPGCGPCSLSAAFVDEAIRRKKCSSVSIEAFDIEKNIAGFARQSLGLCKEELENAGVDCCVDFKIEDFILSQSKFSGFFKNKRFSHVIMNPPYKKISVNSAHRKALKFAEIETVNLYSGFVALAMRQLVDGGELVTIIPRSFCNGPYYKSFREIIIKESVVKHIHIFDSRSDAFADDEVLQENVIIHLVKGGNQSDVVITSSPVADFCYDEDSGSVVATDQTIRRVPFSEIVSPKDKDKFIHIVANERDHSVIKSISLFTSSLVSINAEVSTGPVVDFRMKEDLLQSLEDNSVPLLYPIHFNGGFCWPKESKKANAIRVSDNSKKWLWGNDGYFVVVKRFSSKEEKRRIVAYCYDSSLPGEFIGFDNKLNVFHSNKKGLDKYLALGLCVYLNSTLLDKYYRLFGGHTQVNATDLRNIHYPDVKTLVRIGQSVKFSSITQDEIDSIIEKEIVGMAGSEIINPLVAQEKLDQSLEIVISLGMPRAQQNERSALTLLALLNLHPDGSWEDIENPLIGVTPIMDWCRDVYGKEYAPNTRETFRRQTLHQFVDGGVCLYNPDKPDRAVNSPKACYQISPDLYEVIKRYGTPKWEMTLNGWLNKRLTLVEQYAQYREMEMIPLSLPDGTAIKLSPGAHSQLIHDIVIEFGPRFAPGAKVIYLGDTGAKKDFFDSKKLKELGVTVNRKGKLPDVVLYWPEKDWLLLIEAVTSHGPVDGKRHGELSKLFATATPGIVYVTAFPSRKIMAKYVAEISWETEVWTSEAPTHMIHFNGDRFLGPH